MENGEKEEMRREEHSTVLWFDGHGEWFVDR